MLKTIIDNFTGNIAEWLIYIAIAIVTLIGFFKCILPIMRNGRGLNRATVKLEDGVSSGNGPVWMDKNFLGKSLQNQWGEFLSNAAQLGKRGVGCDTRDYINEETVIEKPGHAQLADLIPGLLTSLGILGTFVGLVMGLSGVDFTTSSGTMDSIRVLLSGMRTAFFTSVAGISCSLVFNMFNRIVIGRTRTALDNFDEAFSELVMARPLQADVAMLCEKKDEDARFAKLFGTFGNQVASSVEGAVGRAMLPLTQSLDDFIQGATQEQMEGISRICSQFVFQMNNTLSDQFKNLDRTLVRVNESQQSLQNQLEVSIQSVRTMNEQATLIAQSCGKVADQLDRLSENLLVQEGTAPVGEHYRKAADGLTKQMAELNASLEKLQSAAESAAVKLAGEEESKA